MKSDCGQMGTFNRTHRPKCLESGTCGVYDDEPQCSVVLAALISSYFEPEVDGIFVIASC